jgi:hypothetical protein
LLSLATRLLLLLCFTSVGVARCRRGCGGS